MNVPLRSFRDRRLALGLSQEDLARRLDVATRTVQRAEQLGPTRQLEALMARAEKSPAAQTPGKVDLRDAYGQPLTHDQVLQLEHGTTYWEREAAGSWAEFRRAVGAMPERTGRTLPFDWFEE